MKNAGVSRISHHLTNRWKEDSREQRGMWCPGEYMRICRKCGSNFVGDKRALYCADCAYDTKQELKCYTNDIDTVIAYSQDDAWDVWCAHSGGKRENYEDDEEWQFYPLSKDTKWTIGNCDGCDGVKTQTLAEWIIDRGRGFLSSTEY